MSPEVKRRETLRSSGDISLTVSRGALPIQNYKKKNAKKSFALCLLAHKFPAVSKSTI